MSPIKTKPSTRDMGLYVPSRVLTALAAASATLDTISQPESPSAGDVIIKMSECVGLLTDAQTIMGHDLGNPDNRVSSLLGLQCVQRITAKIAKINDLFTRLHAGEEPAVVASEFEALTGIKVPLI